MFILYALVTSAALPCILHIVVIAYLLGMQAVTIVMVIIFGDRYQL